MKGSVTSSSATLPGFPHALIIESEPHHSKFGPVGWVREGAFQRAEVAHCFAADNDGRVAEDNAFEDELRT